MCYNLALLFTVRAEGKRFARPVRYYGGGGGGGRGKVPSLTNYVPL